MSAIIRPEDPRLVYHEAWRDMTNGDPEGQIFFSIKSSHD